MITILARLGLIKWQMKTIKTSTDYELLVKTIYAEILNQGNAENIEVKHNQKLSGKLRALRIKLTYCGGSRDSDHYF